MKLAKLKEWWFGLVIKIKGFSIEIGGKCMNKEIRLDDNDGMLGLGL